MKPQRALDQRLRTVRKELNAVRRDIKAVREGRPARTPPPARPSPAADAPAAGPVIYSPGPRPHPDVDSMAAQERPGRPNPAEAQAAEAQIRRRAARLRDERFTDYLAGSVQGLGPLRHERRIQRNKAIVMTVLIVLVATWLVLRFWA